MSIKGSSYARFQRALKTGNLAVIRNAAAELPRVDLDDALAVCMAIRDSDPERFERAALRWLARFCSERAQDVDEVRLAAVAFTGMASGADRPLETLRRLSLEATHPRRRLPDSSPDTRHTDGT